MKDKKSTAPHYIKTHFSDFFGLLPEVLEEYGAFNISLLNDLPLFIDPFLLFNSRNKQYRELHDRMISYLEFLRNKSAAGGVEKGLVQAWYRFPEVRQNWLGFSRKSNRGSGLGSGFANELHENLHRVFTNFGAEQVTKGSHLEKLCLFSEGVGKDHISDFTTNLIKEFLLDYTQTFAKKHIHPTLRRRIRVPKVRFNYITESWESQTYDLPYFEDDYVLLTPKDMLTKDETWINRSDLINDFDQIPYAIANDELRAQINNYFKKQLPEKFTAKERREAVRRTIREFPELIDYFIKFKEDHGDEAQDISALKVFSSDLLYVKQLKQLLQLLSQDTDFYDLLGETYDEAWARVMFLKDVIENKDGYRIFYVKGEPIQREADLQILFRLTWFASSSDVNREVNNGRGPVDFKISRGSRDSTLVEFKLASNSHLKANLEKQVEIYQKAADAKHAIKVILYFSQEQKERVLRILDELKLSEEKNIVLIDARSDNKVSASKA
jgi:hypothetical protein